MSRKGNKAGAKVKSGTADKKLTFGGVISSPFRFLINRGRSFGTLGIILTVIALLVIPYGYVWLCGLVFDLWLKLYDAVVFIFVSLIVLLVLNIAMICLLLAGYFTKGKETLSKK